ncbi:hypothetical protein ABEB36_009325 [Hypothenemus hampei]|uniref:MADF domain-containing protein n=1 Tax=Hypothenemus hampei TaxID=57062 RepID=A0ABD1EG04_HYPHA
MEIDTEKLIILIEQRPAIYNFTIKDHHNREIIDKLWGEVAQETGAQVADCKTKWNSLRNSFTRYIREEKKTPSGSGVSKKKKWYLAGSMSFLKDFVNQHRKQVGNLTTNEDTENNQLPQQDEQIIVDEDILSEMDTGSSTRCSTPDPTKISNKRKASVLQAVTGPMIDFLKSRKAYSLVDDIEKLNPKRQCSFKAKTLQLLNALSDEQEMEAGGLQSFSGTSTLSSTSSSVENYITLDPASEPSVYNFNAPHY